MLQICLAKRGGGKTTYCLNQLEAAFNSQKKAAFLIPEQLSLSTEELVIRKIGYVGNNIEVFSFNRLFRKVYALAHRPKRTYMDEVGKTMLIERITDQNPEKFTIFKGNSSISSGLLSAITEFKRHFASADDLKKVSEAFENRLSKRKFYEFSELLAEYNLALKDNKADSTDNLSLLPDLISETDYLDGFSFYIDGFEGFTPQEIAVITALAKSHRVVVALPFDKDREALFAPIQNTIRLLKDACDSEKIETETITLPEFEQEISAPLKHLRKNYGIYNASPYKEDVNNLIVVSTKSPYAEADSCARRILRLTKKGVKQKDIAVCVPDIEAYLPILEKSFSSHGLTLFADMRVPVMAHSLPRLLLGLCDIFIRDFSKSTVFSFLKNEFIPIPKQEIDLLEFYVSEAGISSASAWKKEWTACPNDSYDLPKLNEIRQKVLGLVLPFREATKGKTPCSVFYEEFIKFMQENHIDDKVNKKIDNINAEEIQTEVGVFNSVLHVLEQLNITFETTSLTLEKVRDLLSAGLSCCTIGHIPPTLDHVTITTSDRSHNIKAKVFFILGVTEDAFANQLGGSGMITDTEREILAENGIHLSATNRQKALYTPFSVYMTLSVPSKLLYLSYPVENKNGEGVVPASVISDLKRMFPKLEEISDFSPDDNSVITTPKATLPHFLKRIEGDTIWEQVYGWYTENEEWKDKIDSYLSAKKYTLSWNLAQKTTESLWGKTLVSSVSRLEKYASCPLSFLLAYGLKLNEKKEHEFTPPEAGDMMHTVMERFVKDMIEEKGDWNCLTFTKTKEKTLELCNEVIKEQTARFPSVSLRYSFLLGRIKNSTVSAMWAVVHHIQSGIFKPVAAEFEFKGDNSPVFTTDNGNTIVLTGKIDRIDAYPEGYRIIDYKSGNKDLKLSSVIAGRSLQLPVYSYALRDKLGNPRGMFYLTVDSALVERAVKPDEFVPDDKLLREYKLTGYSVGETEDLLNMDNKMEGFSTVISARNSKDKVTSSRLLSDDEYQKLEGMAINKVKQFGDEIIGGKYRIYPLLTDTHTSCDYCKFRSICRFDEHYCNMQQDAELTDDEIFDRKGAEE